MLKICRNTHRNISSLANISIMLRILKGFENFTNALFMHRERRVIYFSSYFKLTSHLNFIHRLVVYCSEFLATDPKARVPFLAPPNFLRSSGSGTGSLGRYNSLTDSDGGVFFRSNLPITHLIREKWLIGKFINF
jgi:hypothetical protein